MSDVKAAVTNVVLVHGLFADGSCWSEVIARLQSAGINATAVQNPLTTLEAAVEIAPGDAAIEILLLVLVGLGRLTNGDYGVKAGQFLIVRDRL